MFMCACFYFNTFALAFLFLYMFMGSQPAWLTPWWLRPLCWSEAWGRDSMVSELQVATVDLYGPRRSNWQRLSFILPNRNHSWNDCKFKEIGPSAGAVGRARGKDFHRCRRARQKHADGAVEENRGKFLPKCSTVAEDLVEGTSAVAEAKIPKASDDEDRQRRKSLGKAAKSHLSVPTINT